MDKRINLNTDLTRRGAIICLIALVAAGLFYAVHMPTDTRTRDNVTIYNEGVPNSWCFDEAMQKYEPHNIDNALEERCADIPRMRSQDNDEWLIPGDAIYYARDRFLRDATVFVGLSLLVILLIPLFAWYFIKRHRIGDEEDEE